MQTFMTRKSYHRTMSDLDNHTLWNQYEHAIELCRVRAGLSDRRCPSMHMWRGYDHALVVYVHSTIQERVRRFGKRFNAERGEADPWIEMDRVFRAMGKLPPFDVPPWWNDLDVYKSHRGALMRRHPDHYSDMWAVAPTEAVTLWPVIAEDDPREYSFYISPTEKRKLDAGERILPDNVQERELVYSL